MSHTHLVLTNKINTFITIHDKQSLMHGTYVGIESKFTEHVHGNQLTHKICI
jgi:hypothetical protein